MAHLIFPYLTAVLDLSHAVSISSLGIPDIIIVTVMVIFVALLISLVDQLQKQRVLLDELFEQAPQAIALMSADCRVVRVNREFTQLFGYDRKEVIGRGLRELIVPDELQEEVQKFTGMLAHGQRVESEGVRRRKDGTRLYVSIVHVPFSLSGGRIARYAIYRDITERKRAEEALRQAEEKYRSIIEHAIEGIFQTTPDGQYITANPALARMLGYDSPEELISSRTNIERQQYVEPERRSDFKRLLEEHSVIQGFEYQAYRKDGSKIWLSDNVRAVRDDSGVVLYYEGFTEDITGRKRAEEQLRQSERQLAEAQRLAHIGSWNWDLRSNAVTWSDELYRICGADPQVYNLTYEDVVTEFIHAEDQALFRGVVESSLQSQEPFSFHYRILRLDGEERVIHSRGEIVSDEQGSPIQMFGTAQDVTERKQAEERLRATTEQLRALSARIHSAKEEEGTRIAREIHDELGVALTSLRWDLESFDKAISKAGDRSQIHVLREKIEAMLRLTEATISSVRRISSELRPSVLDDLGLAEAIEWQTRQFQARTGITCRCDCSQGNLDFGREQSTAVFRILQEALTNVLRHARATSVDIMMEAEAGEFVLKIIDNGRGITENEKSGAQSLGLLGMQERAHLIGGKINITGVEGKGTVITVRVPISGSRRI